MTELHSIIDENQLKSAYKISAQIVSIYGDVYFPILERLSRELENIELKNRIKQQALIVLQNNSTSQG